MNGVREKAAESMFILFENYRWCADVSQVSEAPSDDCSHKFKEGCGHLVQFAPTIVTLADALCDH